MARTLGFDVGGAHLKAALAEGKRILRVWQLPTPIWTGLEHLDRALETILSEATASGPIARHAVTMTGELSDIFADRAEGVERLTGILAGRLGEELAIYAGPDGFVAPDAATRHVRSIGSANWHASAALAAASLDEALFVDMGSTTTDIIPVSGGKVCAAGYTDAERLLTGELIYQGYTRTALMAVAAHVPVDGRATAVMNEYFATMADVQRLTDTLDEADDLHPAADGKAKTVAGSQARLARMVGRDAAESADEAWERLAWVFAEAQLRHLHDGVLQVLSRLILSDEAPVVIAGTGRPVLRRLAARLNRGVVDYSDLFDCARDAREALSRAGPAAAVAVLATSVG
ncbi:hydantoinase/oxoprolinase family protein [Mangrovicella endophytica]|uniref:hydantoinase/oxoprolinase family protein n=1 Tax=Mangrovicella endophytica TaxID=2066697 RepID=UPI001FE21EE3|nr:hydantoinase/oxoprolinase family protein [Mangrovicella endophytica]